MQYREKKKETENMKEKLRNMENTMSPIITLVGIPGERERRGLRPYFRSNSWKLLLTPSQLKWKESTLRHTTVGPHSSSGERVSEASREEGETTDWPNEEPS